MQRNRYILSCLVLLAAPALRGDVTLRYETKTTFNPALPPQITEAMMKTLNVALPDMFLQQFRNGKIFYTQGKTNIIVDVANKEITLLDNAGKRYATVPATQYADEITRSIPALPEQAKALLGSMKAHAESAPGGTAAIQGMESEERNISITIDVPAGQALPVSGPLIRVVMHVWMAKGSEALRVPALREVAGYNMMSMEAINPFVNLQKAFQQLPGVGDSVISLTKELSSMSGSIPLRAQIDMFVPILAALPAGGQTPFGAGFDPNASFAQITQELTTMSTDEIPDSVFQVPADYREGTVAEILRAATASVMGQAQLVSRVPPVYPPLAKAARVQGRVTFEALIGKEGTVKDLKLISGPPLLVQSAMDAVKQWVYKPTLLNGEPVEVKTLVDVNFEIQ